MVVKKTWQIKMEEKKMTKEEILEKSRKENANKDLYQMTVDMQAGRVAAIAAALFALVVYLVELVMLGRNNYALWAVVTIMNSSISVYKVVKLKDKKYIFTAIAWILTSVLLIAAMINSFVAGA